MIPFGYWALVALFYLGCSKQLKAQVTIWSEDFSSYADGITQGSNVNSANPDIDWISGGCLACPDSLEDWWEVRSGKMEARDVNVQVFLQTEVIAISNYQNVQFSLEITETGDLEGYYFGADDCVDQANQDYVNILYRLNGGSWILINNYLNWCGLYDSCVSHTLQGDDGEASGDCRFTDEDFDSTKVVHSGLTGDSLEIRVEMINSSSDEYLRIDNIEVSGTLPLPVQWKSFSALPDGERVLLSWETSQERNSHVFIILHNSDDPALTENWKILDSIPAARYSDQLLAYRYWHSKPSNGLNYYQIRQTDHDGEFTLSTIERVRWSSKIKVWPNPAKDFINISWDDAYFRHGKVVVYNYLGEILRVQRISGGNHRMDVASLVQGWYWVRIYLGAENITQFICIEN